MLHFSFRNRPYGFSFNFFGTTLIFVALFSSLGVWQYHRAQQKRLLIQAHADRAQQAPLNDLVLKDSSPEHLYYPIQLKGHYLNQQQILLDNKTHEGRVGYEIYTPFEVANSKKRILIDRGWLPQSANRAELPELKPIQGTQIVKGILSTPPTYFALGAMTETEAKTFPLRVQYINLNELTPLLGQDLSVYVLWLDPQDPRGFVRDWKVVLVGPERHILYTVQWFAFALSLLVIFTVLNLHPLSKKDPRALTRGSGK